MKKYLLSILVPLLFCVSCKEEKFIPKEDMACIMYDCFLIDRCLDENLEYRAQADTTMTYLPVIEKYGYTREQFLESLQHYLSIPKEMSAIYSAAKDRMTQRRQELQVATSDIINTEEKFTNDNIDPQEAARIEEERAAKEKMIQEQDKRGKKRMKGKKIRDNKNKRDIIINEEGAPIVETSVNF